MINGKNILTIGLVSTRKGEKNMIEYKVKYQDANGNINSDVDKKWSYANARKKCKRVITIIT